MITGKGTFSHSGDREGDELRNVEEDEELREERVLGGREQVTQSGEGKGEREEEEEGRLMERPLKIKEERRETHTQEGETVSGKPGSPPTHDSII